MTLTQMSYLIAIAETGSLNKAAEQLYVSQPSLTNAIKEMERELGITLLYRSGRGATECRRRAKLSQNGRHKMSVAAGCQCPKTDGVKCKAREQYNPALLSCVCK